MAVNSFITLAQILTYHLYPMSDYIGVSGCLIVSHLLQTFTPLYNLIFPLTIAVVRLVQIDSASPFKPHSSVL